MIDQEAADQLAALGHPTRLEVLRTLLDFLDEARCTDADPGGRCGPICDGPARSPPT